MESWSHLPPPTPPLHPEAATTAMPSAGPYVGAPPPYVPGHGPGDAASPPPSPGPTPRQPRRTAAGLALALTAAVSLACGTVGGWVAGEAASGKSVLAGPLALTRTSDTLSGASLDVAGVVAKVEPSVVSIQSTVTETTSGTDGSATNPWDDPGSGQTTTGTAAGTGVVLTADGQVVTNAHVVANATNIRVTTTGGRTFPAHVVGEETSKDLALLQLEGASGLTPATLGESGALHVGDDVVAIGNALALEGGPTVTRGIVSALHRSIQTENGNTLTGLVQTDAAISSGNSGGPLVNPQGQVVGINSAVASSSGSVNASNIGFSISVDTVKTELPRLRVGGA